MAQSQIIDVLHYYRLMKDETERMIKLVNDTLDMTQLEEGHSEILRTNYNLTEQINRIIHMLEPHFVKKDLEIRFHADSEYVCTQIKGESNKLWLIFCKMQFNFLIRMPLLIYILLETDLM